MINYGTNSIRMNNWFDDYSPHVHPYLRMSTLTENLRSLRIAPNDVDIVRISATVRREIWKSNNTAIVFSVSSIAPYSAWILSTFAPFRTHATTKHLYPIIGFCVFKNLNEVDFSKKVTRLTNSQYFSWWCLPTLMLPPYRRFLWNLAEKRKRWCQD